MKVCFKNLNKYFTPEQIESIKKFVLLVQKELPLNKDIHISFLGDRKIPMTTGVRMPHHKIYVLSKDRLLIDVLRTLGHEWVHEFQHQKLGLKDTQQIKNIGGPEENMANVLAGIFTKRFEKQFPNYTKILYGEEE
jgi:hypothetical protein